MRHQLSQHIVACIFLKMLQHIRHENNVINVQRREKVLYGTLVQMVVGIRMDGIEVVRESFCAFDSHLPLIFMISGGDV